jgi:hypothetical protein
VDILMTGKDWQDFPAADQAYRLKYGRSVPEGYTWHHTEDGVTMQLVRSDVHAKSESGAAHSGGASIVGGRNPRRTEEF